MSTIKFVITPMMSQIIFGLRPWEYKNTKLRPLKLGNGHTSGQFSAKSQIQKVKNFSKVTRENFGLCVQI